jgi:Dockerin type I domain
MENHMKPITMTFNENISSFARASASCGKVASTSIDGATLTINVTKVSCNASHMTVTVNDVKDSAGINLDSACLEVGLLLGDVNGDGVVDSADLDIVNCQIGQPTNGENFRSDINNDETISAADVRIVTQQQGMRLP